MLNEKQFIDMILRELPGAKKSISNDGETVINVKYYENAAGEFVVECLDNGTCLVLEKGGQRRRLEYPN